MLGYINFKRSKFSFHIVVLLYPVICIITPPWKRNVSILGDLTLPRCSSCCVLLWTSLVRVWPDGGGLGLGFGGWEFFPLLDQQSVSSVKPMGDFDLNIYRFITKYGYQFHWVDFVWLENAHKNILLNIWSNPTVILILFLCCSCPWMLHRILLLLLWLWLLLLLWLLFSKSLVYFCSYVGMLMNREGL